MMKLWGRSVVRRPSRLAVQLQTRGVRTRPPLKELREEGKGNGPGSLRAMLSKDEEKNQEGVKAEKPAKSTKRSRFKSKPDPLQWKSPAQIEKELRSQFEKDQMEYDPEFVQQMIQRSQREHELAKDTLAGGNKAEKAKEEELVAYVDWLIQDCQERLQKGQTEENKQDRVRREMAKMFPSEISEKSLIDAFASVYEVADELAPSGIDQMPVFLDRMNRSENVKTSRKIPLDRLLQLFDISSQLQDDLARDDCIFWAGNLIYRAGKGRADPINERAYILALSNHHRFDEAIQLWESRRDKPDVEGNRFWLDLGAQIYLETWEDNTQKAEVIAEQIKSDYGYIHPLLIATFVRRYLSLGKLTQAKAWCDKMQQVMNIYGLVRHLEVPGAQILKEPQVVYDYYNRVDPVSFDHVTSCAIAFLSQQNVYEAMQIITAATRRDKRYLVEFMDFFVSYVNYPGREHLLLKLQKGPYQPVLSKYMAVKLEENRPTECFSEQETALLCDISHFLFEQSKRKNLNGRKRLLIQSLLSSLSIGAKLTDIECRDLVKILLAGHSENSRKLVARLLDQMGRKSGMLSPANSHMYLVLVQSLARRRRPLIGEIEKIVQLMHALHMPLSTAFANQVLLAYRRAKQYSKALMFIDDYLGMINETMRPTTEFFQNVMVAYRKSVVDVDTIMNGETVDVRRRNLRQVFGAILHTDGWKMDSALLSQMLVTFIDFYDFPSCICALRLYPEKEIPADNVRDVVVKLESKLLSMRNRLPEKLDGSTQEMLSLVNSEIGLSSMYSRIKLGDYFYWKGVAGLLIRYQKVFNYHPTMDSLTDNWMNASSQGTIDAAQQKFETDLAQVEELYGLNHVAIDEMK